MSKWLQSSILRLLKIKFDLFECQELLKIETKSLYKFLDSHCVLCLTNCAEVKELTSAEMQKCNVALNDSIRLIYSYNRWESTRFLRKELKFPNIIEIFFSRKKSFVEKIRGMNNKVVRCLMRHRLESEGR